MEQRYLITVEWCSNGKRGIFCDREGKGFGSETKHSDEDMIDLVGSFTLILSPQSEPFSQEEVARFNRWRPLAEYSNEYGIAMKEKKVMKGDKEIGINPKDVRRWLFIDKDGWPVERINNRPITSFLRLLLHTRRIERYRDYYRRTGVRINFGG